MNMPSDTVVIPYGAATAFDASGVLMADVPLMRVERRADAALRLDSAGYPFAEPPDLVRLVALEDRLDFLREHLKSLCALWDQPPRLFLDAYFRWILAAIDAHRPALVAMATALGGLFVPRDWCFAALRPLPQAHFPTSAGLARVDVGFWTGAAAVAVELVGSASRSRARQEELDRLCRAGTTVVEIAVAALRRDGERCLDATLPPAFHRFWEGRPLPRSPFGAAALDEIVVERDEH
jgi:hypothetical protein